MTIQQALAELKITTDLIPKSNSNRSGAYLKPTFITIHETDNTSRGSNAKAHAKYVKGEAAQARKVSWHYTVDDSEVFKHLPLSEQGQHAGNSKGNQQSIGIEICVNSDGNKAEANRRAALLTAVLMYLFNIPTSRVVTHNYWSGKNCPRNLLKGKSFATFKNQVTESLQGFTAGVPRAGTGGLLAGVFALDEGTSDTVQSSLLAEFDHFEDFDLEDRLHPEPETLSSQEDSSDIRGKIGAIPDLPDFRDQYFVATLIRVPVTKPLEVYLKTKPKILDQGQEGACTGFGLAAVANHLISQVKDRNFSTVSARMLYNMARRYDEWPGESYAGSSARGAMKGWHKHGVCSEKTWPYKVNEEGFLDQKRAAEARKMPLGAYFRVNKNDLVAIHAAIAEVGIVFATAQVHTGWQNVSETGKIQFETSNLGGHAFAIVGYDTQGFWIQNSWGPGWGRQGFGHLSYSDWMANGYDVWVAQLGVPIEETSAVQLLASGQKSGSYNPLIFAELRPHVVTVGNNGVPADNGLFANSLQTIESIIRDDLPEITKNWTKKRIAIYAHGGLVEKQDFIKTFAQYRQTMIKNEVYPLCFVWRTGLFDTLRNIVDERFKELVAHRATFSIADFFDEKIEQLAAKIGRGLWNEMKENALLATHARDGTARCVANALSELSEDYEIHLIGHSAGSIFLAPFAEYLTEGRQLPDDFASDDEGHKLKIESCTLWAPAIRNDEYFESLGRLTEVGKIERMAIYTLSDRAELDDYCEVGIKFYFKSLMFLISNGLEGSRKTPLIGMERFHNRLNAEKNTEIVTANPSRTFLYQPNSVIPADACRAVHHGDFDEDPATLWSTLARINGDTRVTIN